MNRELEQRVKERTAELEASNHELEAFCYSVAHDLSAPLRGMNCFGSILMEDYGDRLGEDGKEYLLRIIASSVRMGKLIDDLLELSRISRLEMRRQKVNLSGMFQEVAKLLKEFEPQRRVEMRPAAGIETVGDPVLLRLVLENLVGNAWKYTSRQPRAEIEFGRLKEKGETIYYLKDNGIGFDMAYVKKIFLPFERLHRVNEFSGNGVGLATVQRIVAKHGGRVWAEGEDGKGATFYFTLAKRQAPSTPEGVCTPLGSPQARPDRLQVSA